MKNDLVRSIFYVQKEELKRGKHTLMGNAKWLSLLMINLEGKILENKKTEVWGGCIRMIFEKGMF